MPITAICPKCQATYKLAEAMFGKQVRCKKCETGFTVGKGPKAAAGVGAGSPTKPVAKRTMMAGDDAIQETKPQAARPAKPVTPAAAGPASPTAKAARAPVPAAPRRPVNDEDDDLVDAVAAPRRPADEEDDLVEAVAAAPRSAPGKQPPKAPPAAPPRRRPDDHDDAEDDLPRGRRRPGRDDIEDRKGRPVDVDAPRRGRAADEFDDPDDDAGPPPRKSRKGLIIGLAVGLVLLLGGGAAVLFFMLKGPSVGPDGVIDSPEVAAKLEDLKEHRDRDGAIFFFANYEKPEKEKRRADVALTLENVLKNNLGRPDLTDTLVLGYCKWASADNINGMMEILDDNGIRRLHQGHLRKHLMLALANFKDARCAEFLARTTRNFFDRGNAIAALETMGDTGKKELTKFYFDNDHGLRIDAQKALSRMGVRDDEFLDPALEVLVNKTHSQRRAAVDFLQNYSGDTTRSKEVCEKLDALIKEKVFVLSDHAVNALPKWVTKDTVVFVAKMVDEADRGRNCENLIRELAKHKDTPGVVEAIAKRMESHHFNETKLATELIEGMGPAVAARAFLSQLNSANHGTKQKAREVLAKMGTGLDLLVAQLIKDLASPAEAVRQSAVQYLAASPPVPKLRDDAAKGLNTLIFDDNFFRREQVFKALMIWWNNDTLVTTCKAVNDPGNRGLRHKCIDFLAKAGDARLATNIAYRLKFDEDRGHAANALRGMGPAAEAGVAPYLLDTDSGVRGEALRIIENIGSSKSIPTLQKAAAVYNTDRGFVLTAGRVAKTISVR